MKKITLLFSLLIAFSLSAQTVIWEDDFESVTSTNNVGEQTDIPAGYLQYDVDGDAISWGISNPVNFTQPFGDIYLGNNFIASASFITTGAGGNGGTGAISPNNILVLPQISIPAGSTGVNLHYFVGSGTDPAFFSETYSVQVTTASDQASILAATPLLDTTLAFQGGETIDINLDAFIGMDIFISFRHYNTTDQWLIGIDDIVVDAVTLSVDEFDTSLFKHSYNRDLNILRLESGNSPINNVQIFNMLGQEVINRQLSNTIENIDMSSLVDGIYLTKISINGDSKTFKILKQ